MKTNIVSGATLAVAAIALALNGASVIPALAKKAPVHCAGINACKSKSSFESASNACKG